MDAFVLSRLQFALNISFHILFPTVTIEKPYKYGPDAANPEDKSEQNDIEDNSHERC